MTGAIISALIGATVVIVLAIIAGALSINSNMASVKTELAVMREREDERDKKIAKMYEWWILTLESGWIAEMKRAKGAGAD